MQTIFVTILQGLKTMGFTVFITYTIFWYTLIYFIETVMFKNIEILCNIENKIYWYDVVFLMLFIYVYVYGIYLFGKYLS